MPKGSLNLASFGMTVSFRSILCALQSEKVTNTQIAILPVATIWVVLPHMFFSCVQDFYSHGPYSHHIYVYKNKIRLVRIAKNRAKQYCKRPYQESIKNMLKTIKLTENTNSQMAQAIH